MHKNLHSLFLLLLIIQTLSFTDFLLPQSDTVYFIFDEPYNNSLPRNYRNSNEHLTDTGKFFPDTIGLSALNISGSAEFSDLNLPLLMEKAGSKKFIVIDLRQEYHGFVNGMPVSWYGKYDWENVGKTKSEIMKVEKHKLDSLGKEKVIVVQKLSDKDKATNTFGKIEDVNVDVRNTETEEDLTKKFNSGYFRITATDHRKPAPEDVDAFVSYVKNLSDDSWLHFHCHAGDGRTTTFMVMYDMMKNAKKVSAEDIVQRQYLLGGIDLFNTENFPDWDKQYAIERKEFLKKFYESCK